MSSNSLQQWRLNSSCRLYWGHWDENYVLFNAASGQTHILNELGVIALQLLQEQALSAAELQERLAARCGLEADAEVRAYIDTMLADFDKLGLVEPYAA